MFFKYICEIRTGNPSLRDRQTGKEREREKPEREERERETKLFSGAIKTILRVFADKKNTYRKVRRREREVLRGEKGKS